MLLNLTKEQKRLHTRLYVSSSDLGYAGACAAFLLKKGWHTLPWERRGSIYFQQSAFTSAMVTAYARPFTSYKKQKWGSYLLELLEYNEQQLALHKTLIDMRNEIYAHSDPRLHDIRPWRAESFETIIVGQPFLRVSAPDCKQIQMIASRANSALMEKMQSLVREIE